MVFGSIPCSFTRNPSLSQTATKLISSFCSIIFAAALPSPPHPRIAIFIMP